MNEHKCRNGRKLTDLRSDVVKKATYDDMVEVQLRNKKIKSRM